MYFLYANPILESEFAMLQTAAVAYQEGYYVCFKSKDFPSWRDGHSLWCLDHPNVRVYKLIQKFRKCFPDTKHVNIYLNGWNDERLLQVEAKAEGFTTIGRLRFMSGKSGGPYPDSSYEIKKISSNADWQDYREHIRACNPNNSWFSEEGYMKTRQTSKALPIHWFMLKKEGKVLSSAGIFKHRHLGRMQSIMTDPNHSRHGLSRLLMKHIMAYAKRELQVEEVVLLCDPAYHAYTFYQSMGFEDRMDIYQLKK